MDRNLALEFVRVTEAAAISAALWIGRGDKHSADQAAVDAMRTRLNLISFKGKIVIGEGKKDSAPELYIGESVGSAKDPVMDLAIDPLECTDSVANGRYNALSVIASGPEGSLFQAPDTYMNKIAVGKDAASVIDLAAPVELNIKKAAKALGKDIKEMTIIVLDRERHLKLIDTIRKAGARVRLITDGDVAGAIAPCLPESGIDMLLGIGASAEAVLAATAVRTLGGEILCAFAPQKESQHKELAAFGITDTKKIYRSTELAKSQNVTFTATGVIEGPLLKGVWFHEHGIITNSIVIRGGSRTIRYIKTFHHEN